MSSLSFLPSGSPLIVLWASAVQRLWLSRVTRASHLLVHQAYLVSVALVEKEGGTTQHVSDAQQGSTRGQCIWRALVTGKWSYLLIVSFSVFPRLPPLWPGCLWSLAQCPSESEISPQLPFLLILRVFKIPPLTLWKRDACFHRAFEE